MKLPSLCLITHPSKKYTNIEIVNYAVKDGIRWIQLRDKTANIFTLYNQAVLIKKIIAKKKILFIINDSVEICLAVNADGVHLGKEDLPVKIARNILGKNKIIGRTCKNIKDIIEAEKQGADYISVGPIFQSITKPNAGKILGIEFIKEVKKHTNLPIIAIGGINKDNIIDCFKAGATSVAVISAIVNQKNIQKNVQELQDRIKNEFNEFGKK